MAYIFFLVYRQHNNSNKIKKKQNSLLLFRSMFAALCNVHLQLKGSGRMIHFSTEQLFAMSEYCIYCCMHLCFYIFSFLPSGQLEFDALSPIPFGFPKFDGSDYAFAFDARL